MIVLGATSDTAVAFVEYYLSKEQPKKIYLSCFNEAELERIAQHYRVKYQVEVSTIPIDLSLNDGCLNFDHVNDFNLVFCTTGFLGKPISEGLYDYSDTKRIISVNYANLIVLLSFLSEKLEKKGSGNIIVFSSVAGDRGRASNFIYGSAKAGLSAYLSGLRAYLSSKGVHVITIKPGFMNTAMTAHLQLPKILTAMPNQVAEKVYLALKKKKNVVYIYSVWRYIMLIIKLIPESIFKKLPL